MPSCDERILMMTCLLLCVLLFQTWPHTVPPSEPEANYSQIMEALAAIQGGMSTMQQSISSLQLEVRSINKRVEHIWTFRSAFESIIRTAVMMGCCISDCTHTRGCLISLCFYCYFVVILRHFVIFCYFVKNIN